MIILLILGCGLLKIEKIFVVEDKMEDTKNEFSDEYCSYRTNKNSLENKNIEENKKLENEFSEKNNKLDNKFNEEKKQLKKKYKEERCQIEKNIKKKKANYLRIMSF